MKVKDLASTDPFDDRFREEGIKHKAEETKINNTTDWLEVFPEAKDYIFTKSIELGKKIIEIQTAWKEHKNQIDVESEGEERETRYLLISALYQLDIDKKANQLHLMASTVRKHITKKYYKNSSHPNKGFSQEEIETARNTSIVSLFESDGNILKRSGSNFVTHCPFHDEKTPSCTIYCNENRYYCYGCNAKGNPIDYLITRHQKSFKEAIQILIGK